MPISLIPGTRTIASGASIAFRASVTGGQPGPVTLTLAGPRGTPLPQSRILELDDAGRGGVTFAAVAFTAAAQTVTTVTCTAPGGSLAAGVATVSITPAAHELAVVARKFRTTAKPKPKPKPKPKKKKKAVTKPKKKKLKTKTDKTKKGARR